MEHKSWCFYSSVEDNGDEDDDETSFASVCINIVGNKFKVVGYWTNETQLSVNPPINISDAHFVESQDSALPILWPGDLKEAPRGWVLPKNGRPLKIAVPKKIGFEQFLSYSISNSTNETNITGYCIDVFKEALRHVPYSVPYTFELYGNESGPIYDDMITDLAHKVRTNSHILCHFGIIYRYVSVKITVLNSKTVSSHESESSHVSLVIEHVSIHFLFPLDNLMETTGLYFDKCSLFTLGHRI